MRMKNSKIRAIDLFSGCGGVSIGLTQAGFNVSCAVEIDNDAVKTYRNYPLLKNVNVLERDISTLSGKEILDAGGIKRGEMYLLAGCPPCQNFSLQNRQNREKTEEEKKGLLLEFLRIIKEVYPPFILMENVPGIKTANKGKILNEFITRLKNDNCNKIDQQYNVVCDILNAADYGVPQTRKRFVLHAVRKDVFEIMKKIKIDISLPKQTHSRDGSNKLSKWITVWDKISDLPKIKAGQRYSDDKIKNHDCANLSPLNIQRIEWIRSHGGSRSSLPSKMVLNCHEKYQGHKDVYGVMDKNKPAPTLTGGCISYSKGRFGHPTQNRAISIREAARLQTFPDDFEFGNSITKAALQIGNAVPVRLVEVSGEQLLNTIEKIIDNKNRN